MIATARAGGRACSRGPQRRRSRLGSCSPGLRPSSPTFPGPAPRSGCTTPLAARWSPPRPTGRRACTSAASPRTTPRTSGMRPRTWPSTWSTGCGGTPGTPCTTCRTSPTSTTRCWSGPSATARTGSRSPMRETALFREDMTALRVLPPDDYVGAVESIPRDRRRASRNCSTRAWPTCSTTAPATSTTTSAQAPGFGRESRYDARHDASAVRRARRRPRPRRASGTRWTRCSGAASDRTSRPGTAPLGPGRPGWHIECAAIALDRLGMAFDVQGGGSRSRLPASRALRRARRGADRH